ncbi:MAG: DUF6067 family protein [Kiritimatiellales bacterium]|nr:DUF6067 family protein [Kiritimatiellales bacterium]
MENRRNYRVGCRGRFTVLVGLLFVLACSVSVATGSGRGLLCQIPFHGEEPLRTGSDEVRVVNPDKLTDHLQGDGLNVGGGRGGVSVPIEFDKWDVTAGTISFWFTPVDWHNASFDIVGAKPKGKGHFRCALGPHSLRCWGFGPAPGKTWPRIGTAEADWLSSLEPGDWRHLALVWEKGVFITAYLDGKPYPWKKTAFPWPDAFSTLWVGSTHPSSTDWTKVKDFRAYSRPLMPGEIAALAGKTMKFAADTQANVTPVGLTENAPKIDGVVGENEYPTVVPGLLDLAENALYPEHAAVHTALADGHLYVAATVALPGDYTPESTVQERDDEHMLDTDSFHLLIRSDTDTESEKFSAAYLCIAPDGVLYDALETADWVAGEINRDATRNYGVDSATRIVDGRWTVETRIPLAELGLSTDRPFSFALGYYLKGLSRKRISLQIHPKGFDHPQAFGIGRFVPMNVRVQVGELARGTVGLDMRLRNTGGEELSGQAEYSIAKPEITQSEADWDFDQRIGEKIAVAACGQIQEWSTDFTLESGAWDELSDTNRLVDPGSYLLVSQASLDGVPFYRRTLPFTYFSPVESSLKPAPSTQGIKAETSLYGIHLDDVNEIEFRLPSIEGGTRAQRFLVTQRRETFPLDMSDLPAGEHEIEIALLDVNENEVASRIVEFKKLPEPEWLKNRVALEALEPDWVPGPWTPMTVDGLKVGVWGRTFQFSNDSPLPKMTSQDTPLTTKPAKIAYTTDEGEFELEIRDTRIESKNRGRVVVRQSGESPHFDYEARHVIEFDGLDIITINLAPKAAVNVKTLRFHIPLSAVRYYSSHRYSLGILREPQEFGSINYLWLGNDAVGLDWVTENYKGWLVNSEKARMTLTDKPDGAVLQLLLANEATRVEEPMEIRFSIQPTPIKPLPRGFRGWRISTSWWEDITTHWIALWSRWSSALSTPKPRNEQLLNDMLEHKREYGYHVYPFMIPSTINLNNVIGAEVPFFVNYGDLPAKYEKTLVIKEADKAPKIEEAWYYAEDWQVHPQISGGVAPNAMYKCSMSSSFADYYAYHLDQMARKGLDGVYFDLASVAENFDLGKNLTYKTLDGKTEGTCEIFATRDFYKRLYYVFDKHRGEEKMPYILGHGFPIGLAYRGFWSVCFHGEGMKPAERFDMTHWYLQTSLRNTDADGVQQSYMYTTEPDAERSFEAVGYRLSYPQRQTGIPMLILPQYAKATRDKKTNLARRKDPALAREMLAFTVLHNNLLWPTWIDAGAVVEYWRTVEIPFAIGDTEFHGYWENEIDTNADHIKASYWKKNGETDYLVAVANWSDEEQTARITLPDFIAELGPGHDMEARSSVKSIDEDGRIELTVPRNDFRVVRFRGL